MQSMDHVHHAITIEGENHVGSVLSHNANTHERAMTESEGRHNDGRVHYFVTMPMKGPSRVIIAME